MKTSIFDKMLKDGGKETENGILYKGFEYRTLYDNDATPDYLDSVLQNIGIKETSQLMDNTKTYIPFYVACNIIYDFEKHKRLVPMQPGDVPVTYADTSALERDFGFKPQTSLREGLRKFAQWYYEFYQK